MSYSRVDSALARQLHDAIEDADPQLSIWWDQENRLARDWTEQIMAALRGSNAMIAVVTRHSVGSDGVKREALLAEKLKREVLAILYEPEDVLLAQERCGLMYLLVNAQWLAAWDDQSPVPVIVSFLQDRRAAQPPPDPPTPPKDPYPPPPPPNQQRARLDLVLNGTLANFGAKQREEFINLIATFTNLPTDQIGLIQVRAGSIIVTLELPLATARWLQELSDAEAPILKALDIQRVEALYPQTQPRPAPPRPSLFERLRDWLGAGRNRLQLAGMGGMLAVLALALVLVRPFGPAAPASIALCGDLSLSSGRCTTGQPVAFFSGERLSTSLSGAAQDIPQIITPRRSDLLGDQPTVRWTAVADTASYTLTLRQGVTPLWSTVITGSTVLAYPPAEAPPLERGSTYRFEVITASGQVETAQGIGFTLLSAAAAAPIEAEVAALRARGDAAETTAVLLANLYAQHRLYAEALELLEPLADRSNLPVVSLLRGNLLVSIGLPALAQSAYERAIALAEQHNDQISQAMAHARLAAILARAGGSANLSAARSHYEQAIRLYKELGDAAQANQLAQDMAALP